MSEIKIKSYGKINLSLDVTGVREDGYHTLETVMQKISLYDEVIVEWKKQDTDSIEIVLNSNKPFLPRDERNIAYKAAQIMKDRYGEGIGGGQISIYLKKQLPVSAGLAGGSGNGATVLIALNRLWKLRLGTRTLCKLGEELGADVPFCVLTQNTRYGCALGTGTGAELTTIRTPFKKGLLLVKPAFGVSTKEVYQAIDDCAIEERPDTERLIDALKEGDDYVIYSNMINVLEAYTLNRYMEVKAIKEEVAKDRFAQKVLMTGSGPTVFALFEDVKKARKACLTMREKGYEAYWGKTL